MKEIRWILILMLGGGGGGSMLRLKSNEFPVASSWTLRAKH